MENYDRSNQSEDVQAKESVPELDEPEQEGVNIISRTINVCVLLCLLFLPLSIFLFGIGISWVFICFWLFYAAFVSTLWEQVGQEMEDK